MSQIFTKLNNHFGKNTVMLQTVYETCQAFKQNVATALFFERRIFTREDCAVWRYPNAIKWQLYIVIIYRRSQ